MIKQLAAKGIQWFEQLAERERALLLLVWLVLIVIVWHSLLFNPMQVNKRALLKQQLLVKDEIGVLDQQYQTLQEKLRSGPAIKIRQAQTKLEAELAALGEKMSQVSNKLVSPRQLILVIKTIVSHEQGLTLVSLKTLPIQPVTLPNDDPAHTADGALYQHGLSLVLRGHYYATLAFLKALEQSPWQLYWDHLDYQVTQYPEAKIQLKLHTLGHRLSQSGSPIEKDAS